MPLPYLTTFLFPYSWFDLFSRRSFTALFGFAFRAGDTGPTYRPMHSSVSRLVRLQTSHCRVVASLLPNGIQLPDPVLETSFGPF